MSKHNSRWPSVRLKYLVSLDNSRAEDTSELPYVGLENIESGTGRLVDVSIPEGNGPAAAGYFEPGDVLFSKLRPYLAKAFVAEEEGICTTELLVMKPGEDVAPDFLLYALLSPDFIDEVDGSTYGSKMPRADWDFIGNVEMPIPPLPEQRAIAARLDRETARLDTLTGEYRQLIDGLAEKRRALVAHAVTRGLDPGAPTSNTGIDWLGEVPAHWPLIRLRYLAQIGNGSTPKRSNPEYWKGGDIPWLNSSVANEDTVTKPSGYVTDTAVAECHLPHVPAGSVLVAITGQGKTRGMAAVLSFEATINQHLAFLTPKPQMVSTEYLWMALTGLYDALRYVSDSQGGTRGAITLDQLGGFSLPVPPLGEQREIVAHVEHESAALTKLTTEAKTALALLAERRGALIAEAVSGPALPELAPTTS